MKDKQIKGALEEYASRNVPTNTDLWPDILMQVSVKPQDPLLRLQEVHKQPDIWGDHPVRRSNFGPSLASLITIMLIVGGAVVFMLRPYQTYIPAAGIASMPDATHTPGVAPTQPATTSKDTFNILILDNAGLQHVEKLGVPLNVSQTVGLYTVNLLRAYADANHLIIEYSVKGPDGESLAGINNVVKESAGTIFPQIFGTKGISATDKYSYAIGFDTSALARLSQELSVSLSLDVAKLGVNGIGSPMLPDLSPESGSWNTIIETRTTSIETDTTSLDGSIGRNQSEKVAGPFNFTFTIPVTTTGTSIVQPNQTVSSSGVSITLERVALTAGEFRASLSFNAPDGVSPAWVPEITLENGNFSSKGTANHSLTEIMRADSQGHWTFSLLEPPSDNKGEWTLTISELKSGDDLPMMGVMPGQPSDTLGSAKHLAGPWVFKFTFK